jgi:hypothetical protein
MDVGSILNHLLLAETRTGGVEKCLINRGRMAGECRKSCVKGRQLVGVG